MNQKLVDLVEQANERLKASGIRLKIELRTARLNLGIDWIDLPKITSKMWLETDFQGFT